MKAHPMHPYQHWARTTGTKGGMRVVRQQERVSNAPGIGYQLCGDGRLLENYKCGRINVVQSVSRIG
jgi:hypothetical protein